MTARLDSMPCLNAARTQWDAEAGKVRYFACFEGSNDWIEVPGEDFARLTQHFAQEAIDVICDSVLSTLDRVNAAMEDFAVFRKAMESMMPKSPAPEGGN